MDFDTLVQQYSSIPNELKQMPRWIGYRVENIANSTKKTKKPYNALNGSLASTRDDLTWTSFNLALKGCIKFNFDGLGFVLGDGIFGVDLDNHINEEGNYELSEEEFNALTQEFLTTLNSYSEYSQSGNGIHIICKGKLPEGACRKGNVEMYDNARFFAMTGKAINNCEVENRENEVVPLWEKYVYTAPPQIEVNNAFSSLSTKAYLTPLSISDEEIIKLATSSKNGGDFYSLFYEGDLSGNNNDHSRADLALCTLLAFWTNKDKVQIDRIFRRSALMRDKWDRKLGISTYGEKTIETACIGTVNTYVKTELNSIFTIKDTTIPDDAPLFIEDENTDVSFSQDHPCEETLNEDGEPIFKIKKIFKKYVYNDTGNALRFYDYFNEYFRYNKTDKCFLFWDGKSWIKDDKDIIRKFANKFIDILKDEEKEIQGNMQEAIAAGDALKAKQLEKVLDAAQKNTARVSNKAGKDAMLAEFQSLYDIPVVSSELDSNDYLLNTTSGVVDLKTGQIKPFDKKLLLSKNTNTKVSYDPPTTWLKFLWDVFDKGDSKQTQDLIDSVQTCLGYTLTGSTVENVMFFLYGRGSNGKSTFSETILRILGTYGQSIQANVLMQKRESSSATFSIAKLQKTRFVSTGETEENGKLAEAQVKVLTGGDTISAQFKYGNEFDFRPKFKIWMSTNHRPIIWGTDDGIWRRIYMFPFENSFTGARKDKSLPEKLKKEDAQILGWCIQGYLKYIKNGNNFAQSEKILETISAYKEQMDDIQIFINSECILEEGVSIDSKELYSIYKSWALDNAEHVRKERQFSEELRNKGIPLIKKPTGNSVYSGIRKAGVFIKNKVDFEYM